MRSVRSFLAVAALAAVAFPQVAPDAGPDQTVFLGAAAPLTGRLDNRAPLDVWTSDGNFATEDCVLMHRDGQRLRASPRLVPTIGGVFGWPSDLQRIGGQVYGIESYRRYLYTVDVATGLCTPIGPANAWQDVYCLAYDAGIDRMYAVDLLKKQLLWIDRHTGVVTKIGHQTLAGYFLIRALAFRVADGQLYALDQGKNMLLRIDPATGLPTPVKQWPKVPTSRVEELEFHGDHLYAMLGLLDANGDLYAGQLQRIDLQSLTISDVGPVLEQCSPHSLLLQSVPEPFQWSRQSGPGTVQFADPRALATTATFSAPGTYVLALTAYPLGAQVSDTTTILVR